MLARRGFLCGRRFATYSSHHVLSPWECANVKIDDKYSMWNGDSQQQKVRCFHATRKQEILPVIGVAVVFVLARYSWKALNRMDEEWEEYQWQLQQYERQIAKSADMDRPPTIGIDFGTIYVKLAQVYGKIPHPELLITRQGDRYRFNGVLVEQTETSRAITGKVALDKFFYKPPSSTAVEKIQLPYWKMKDGDNSSSRSDLSRMISDILTPALEEVKDNLPKEVSSTTRTVISLPPEQFNDDTQTLYRESGIVTDSNNNGDDIVFLPEPVAAIWGAQSLNLLPTPSDPNDSPITLVLDMGGFATCLSIVQNDKILASITLDGIGGEAFVQQMVYRTLEESPTQSYDISNDAMVLQLIHQQVRESVIELTNKSQTKIHVPFLFMSNQDNPHLDLNISRTVVEQAVEDYWRKDIYPQLTDKCSNQMPPPTDFKSLVTSVFTALLEQCQLMPQSLDHILLVGGGMRYPKIVQGCKEGISVLLGPSATNIVSPDPSIVSELTGLGASSLLPNYSYSYDSGLIRQEDN